MNDEVEQSMKRPIQVEVVAVADEPGVEVAQGVANTKAADPVWKLGHGIGSMSDTLYADDPKRAAEYRRRLSLKHAVRVAPPNVAGTEVVLNAKLFERYLKGEE